MTDLGHGASAVEGGAEIMNALAEADEGRRHGDQTFRGR